MVIHNPFKPKTYATPGEELLATSEIPLTIPAMLAESRAQYADRLAYQQKIDGQWQRLTHEAAYSQARDFAAGLIAMGVQKGDRVAIVAENSLSWTIAYFGLSMAGAVGVPLYYELKAGEIEEMIKRSGARVLVASTKVLSRLGERPGGVEQVVVVGEGRSRAGHAPGFLRRARAGMLPFDQVAALATDVSRAELARRHVEPDDLASIVFTSGTTGGTKGVMLTHQNFMSNIESIRRTITLDDRDRIVLVLPVHHAFPFIIFLAAFYFGGELTFENDLLRVRDRLQEIKPTIFLGMPALFEQMFRTIQRRAEGEGRGEMFARGLRVVEVAKRRTGVNLGKVVFREIHQLLGGQLRWVLSGGAALNPDTTRKFFLLGLPLLQGWGLTEASPVVAAQRWLPRRFFFSNYYEEHVGTVGPPLEGVEVRLIDVPEKEIYVHLHGEGELVVRGPNVFAGYWQAPEATAAAKAGGWLRTGDLGRIDEEGNIWITGRSKYVIVLDSGEKVVPDELEERFAMSDLFQDVCVVPRRQRNKTQIGVIIYPSIEAVQQALQERGKPVDDASVRAIVQEELETLMNEVAPYKRVSELILSDQPLPKTAGLQKVIRERLHDTYHFDAKRWQAGPQPDAPPAAAQ